MTILPVSPAEDNPVIPTQNSAVIPTQNNSVIPTVAIASRSEATAEWRDLLL